MKLDAEMLSSLEGLPRSDADHRRPMSGHTVAVLIGIEGDGGLLVQDAAGQSFVCDVLLGPWDGSNPPRTGDRVLVLSLPSESRPIVLGRIGRYTPPQPQPTVTIEATESLTLKCGEASVDLRADGKVMVRGEDVLLRAKGTQRIRAGNVAIN